MSPLQQRLCCCFFEGKLAISPFFNLQLLGKTWFWNHLQSYSSFRLKPCAWCVHHHHGFSESSRKIIFWWKKNINPITDSKLAKSLCHQATQGFCKKSKSTWCFWVYFLLWKHESNFKMPKPGSQCLGGNSQRNVFFPTLLCIAMTIPISGEQ